MTGLLGPRARPILTATLAASAVAAIGGLSTSLTPWYYALRKPTWQPPDWLFGPAWTLIFALTAFAGVEFWRTERRAYTRALVLVLLAANGALNITWSVLFFRLQRPDWALYEVSLLWLSIVLLILAVRRASLRAGLLLVPYLLWVSFASFLNWTIVRLNGT